MDDAVLDLGIGIDAFDGFREARQAIDTSDQCP